MSVLTPVESSSAPEPQRSLTILPPDAALPVRDEVEEAEPAVESDLPDELKRKGLKGFLTGRIDVKIVSPFIVVMAVMAILGSFVVLNLVTGSLADRFKNQL